MSRRHAVFEALDGGWCLRDLQSHNGTFVKGARITDLVALRPNDEIRIGGCRFRYTKESENPEANINEGASDDADRLN